MKYYNTRKIFNSPQIFQIQQINLYSFSLFEYNMSNYRNILNISKNMQFGY